MVQNYYLLGIFLVLLLSGTVFPAPTLGRKAQIVEDCSTYFDGTTKILKVPAGKTCSLTQDHTVRDGTLIKKLRIEGKMYVYGQNPQLIEYEELELLQTGHIHFGLDDGRFASLHTLNIVFNRVNSNPCQLPKIVNPDTEFFTEYGTMSVNGLRFLHSSLIKSTQAELPIIEVKDVISDDIFPNAKILIIDPVSPNKSQALTVETSVLSRITVKENLSHKYRVRPIGTNNNSHPFIMTLPESNQLNKGVIFENACLTTNIREMQGVHFLNPQGLYLKGGILKNSIVTNSNRSGQEKIQLHFGSEIKDTIFFESYKLNLSFHPSTRISGLLILKSMDFEILPSSPQLSQITFLESSKIQINLSRVKAIEFKGFHIFDSEVFFNGEETLQQEVPSLPLPKPTLNNQQQPAAARPPNVVGQKLTTPVFPTAAAVTSSTFTSKTSTTSTNASTTTQNELQTETQSTSSKQPAQTISSKGSLPDPLPLPKQPLPPGNSGTPPKLPPSPQEKTTLTSATTGSQQEGTSTVASKLKSVSKREIRSNISSGNTLSPEGQPPSSIKKKKVSIQFTDDCVIMKGSRIEINYDLDSLKFSNCNLIHVQFDFRAIEIETFTIQDSFIFGESTEDLFTLSSSEGKRTSIFLTKTVFSGKFQKLFTDLIKKRELTQQQSTLSQQQNINVLPLPLSEQVPTPTRFHFTLKEVTFNLQIGYWVYSFSQSLFDIESMDLVEVMPDGSLQKLIEVEEYNMHSNFIRRPIFMFKGNTNKFFTRSPPSYYLIKNISSSRPRILGLSIEVPYDDHRIHLNKPVQIFKGKSHLIQLNSYRPLENKENLIALTLLSDESSRSTFTQTSADADSSQGEQQFQRQEYMSLTFDRFQRGISAATVTSDSIEYEPKLISEDFECTSNICYSFTPKHITITFRAPKSKNIDIDIEFTLCYPQSHVTSNGKCSLGCEYQIQDYQCSEQCIKSYYYNVNSNKCVKKLKNCDVYSDKTWNCIECKPGMILKADSCFNSCSQSEYEKDNRCYPCQKGCQHCIDDQTCLALNDPQFSVCQPGEYLYNGKCHLCHSSCQSCVAPGVIGCTTCNYGLEFQFGICLPK